jgi:hypothetical protein
MRIYRRNPFQRPGGMERSLHGHRLVAEAILAGDDIAAEAAMHEHVIGAVGLMDFLAELPDEPVSAAQAISGAEAPQAKRKAADPGSRTRTPSRRKAPDTP